MNQRLKESVSKAAEDLAKDPEMNLIDAIYARRSVKVIWIRKCPGKFLTGFLK